MGGDALISACRPLGRLNKVNVTLIRLIQVKNWPFVGRKTFMAFSFFMVSKYSKLSLEKLSKKQTLKGQVTSESREAGIYMGTKQ